MAQGPSDTILVAIRITLRIRESNVRNPDPPDWRRFVLSEHSFLVFYSFWYIVYCVITGLVIRLAYIVSPCISLFFSTGQEIGKSMPKMTCFVLSGALSINSVHQSINSAANATSSQLLTHVFCICIWTHLPWSPWFSVESFYLLRMFLSVRRVGPSNVCIVLL